MTVRAFAKAVSWGTLAGAGPILLGTVPLALFSLADGGIKGPGSLGATLHMAALPLLYTFQIVLVAAAVMGIPAALLLRRMRRETRDAYSAAGGVAGLLVPLVPLIILGAPDGYWLSLLGAFSGAVTGHVWWRETRTPPTPDHAAMHARSGNAAPSAPPGDPPLSGLEATLLPEEQMTRPIAAGTRIGHVHLKVADLDRALAFYCDVLGFELQQRYGAQAAFVSAGGYHHHIGLNTWESRGGQPPAPGTTGLFHVAILYPTRADLADALRRLDAAGVPLQGASDHGVSQALYLSDPDGNGVELYWDRPEEDWPRDAQGGLKMVTERLDLAALRAAAE